MLDGLYTVSGIRQIEKYAQKTLGLSSSQLMQRAGWAAFKLIKQHWPKVTHLIILTGSGNNAGDGYVLGALAQQQGMQVQIYYASSPGRLRGPAAAAAEQCLQQGVSTFAAEQWDHTQSADAETTNQKPETTLIVDALLGIGFHGEMRANYLHIVERVNASPWPVLALDLPTGVEADTGQVRSMAIQADVTLTFLGLKQGLFTADAVNYCGEIICEDLGVPAAAFQTTRTQSRLLTWEHLKPLLPRRQRSAHKGCYGHVLVIGGDYGMGGAVRLAAEAALRVGAGLVTVATRPEHVLIVTASRPELMCHQIDHAEDLEPLLARATVIVIGPGLGQSEWSQMLLNRVLECDQPKLIDADGLNLLSQEPQRQDNWILTPHPGEAARLLATGINEVQSNRFYSAQKIQNRYGGVVVLKGAGTIVCVENGSNKVCPAGNPGMASAGMGDILSGVIGGLLAQGLVLSDAACVGVFVHALAADRAASEDGERGLLATDTLNYLRRWVNPEAATTKYEG